MKRSIILFTLILSVSGVFAQMSNVNKASSDVDAGKLEQAYEEIETAIDPANEKSEKSIDNPKTWEVRGDVYAAIYKSADENVKKLSDNPLGVALDSYKKALDLDEKGRNGKGIQIKLVLLFQDFQNRAIDAFNENDYDKAYDSFIKMMEINQLDVMNEDNADIVDTALIYNAGLAAYNAQKYDDAIKYLNEAARYGYNEGQPFVLISVAYQMEKDTAKALETLKEGFEKYPDDQNILTNMIQIYLDQQKTNDAMKYLQMAIDQDPNNASFYFALGRLYEDLNDEDKAIELYQKSIEVDDSYFNSYYNLGALYYNKGVEQIDVAREIPPSENEKYQAELAKADVWFEKALPYMKKCHELDPKEPSTIESLKNLYYRMMSKDEAKYKPLYEEMDSLLNQ